MFYTTYIHLVNYSALCTENLIIEIKFEDSFEKIDFENAPGIFKFKKRRSFILKECVLHSLKLTFYILSINARLNGTSNA